MPIAPTTFIGTRELTVSYVYYILDAKIADNLAAVAVAAVTFAFSQYSDLLSILFFRRSLSIRVINFALYLCHLSLNPHHSASALQHLEMCTDLPQLYFQLSRLKIDFSQTGM